MLLYWENVSKIGMSEGACIGEERDSGKLTTRQHWV